MLLVHCKQGYRFSRPRESLVNDIPAGDGKIANLFLQCTCAVELAKNVDEREVCTDSQACLHMQGKYSSTRINGEAKNGRHDCQ